ncbi:putative kinase-like protein TMKL1 [Typha angustifolia]|uniref:putative kinase-like protein TMKL1 n=1 Tax=Typha angustifolia TaxID=59011 RepID=UPI003C2F54CC
MARYRRVKIIFGVVLPFLLLLLLFYCYYLQRRLRLRRRSKRREALESGVFGGDLEGEKEDEELIAFSGGENLTVGAILEAPGEVVGKSSYATLYRASVQRTGSVMLLRFVRPACVGRSKEILPAIRILGSIRHPNLVPLRALYVGPRGEKLFVHPFYAAGSLARFLRDGVAESHRWEIICKLSLGIAKGIDHLHTALQKPIVHGNLKANNILLDADFQPRLSDFGMHLLLNPTAGQELLETSAAQGYKAPELIKMKDASRESDIYSLGVVLLEMLTQKEPMSGGNMLQSQDLHVPTSFRDLILEQKISNAFSSELIKQSKDSAKEEGLLMFFQLAMACCSPSPALRPDIKSILQRLEEIVH